MIGSTSDDAQSLYLYRHFRWRRVGFPIDPAGPGDDYSSRQSLAPKKMLFTNAESSQLAKHRSSFGRSIIFMPSFS
jgi:hypothetical protein